MKKIIVIALAVFLCSPAAFAAYDAGLPVFPEFEYWRANNSESLTVINHREWDSLLAEFVYPNADGVNRVDYRAINEDRARLDDYIAMLETVTVTNLNEEEQLAYWINLYNAVTVQVIVQHYPVKSIRDIKFTWWVSGPWKEKLVTVESRALSLDNIEHNIVRPIFGDNRVHYAFNCASIGCPNLRTRAFTPDNLDAMLDAAARDFINHPRGVRFDGDELIVSSIFNWYAEDFGEVWSDVIADFAQYAAPALRARLDGVQVINDFFYDWSLNDGGN